MWLPRFLTRRASAPTGFAERATALHPPPAAAQRPAPLGEAEPGEAEQGELGPGAHPGWSVPTPPATPPFPDTGPTGHRDRMRARVLNSGTDGLADYELMEMLLFGVFRKGDTKPLAKRLINRFGSFAGVLAAPPRDVATVEGVGPHTLVMIRIVQAAAIRLARAEVAERPVLGNWDRLMDYLNAVLAREKIEQFRILFLDTKNRLIADEAQARGTVNHTPVYPREVVKRALELHATALILVHNHPSGDPTPSEDDLDMTREIQMAAGIFGIALHDHIVVGNGRWTSFRREGLLGRR